jgi:AcrR family transcriptional regulator
MSSEQDDAAQPARRPPAGEAPAGEARAGEARPLRADAQTNRARILDAAAEVFGRGGESASTEEVARLAGVGIATVFRHFPTKADLLDAVLVRRFARLRERAERLAGSDDPGRALFDMFAEMVSDAPSKIAIAEALAAVDDDAGSQAEQASAELSQVVGVLLQRAQAAGAVRADVRLPELYALLIGMSRAAAYAELDPGVRARALAVVFDGLAAPRPAAGAAG